MNPRYPIFIVSKGRWESRLTSKSLEAMAVPYKIVVEEQEYLDYAAVIDPAKILVLDKKYQRDYDTCDNLGDTKSRGPGPARNFVWDYAVAQGAEWHWVMDDNIRDFWRLNQNRRIRFRDGTIFRCMEDFTLRYTNIAMAGPNYFMFCPNIKKQYPFILNTRIYSCNLIRNDIPYRWRGRYNEDTDLSLRILKGGNCTVLFNAFLQKKTATQEMLGGNTKEFYALEGTLPKSQMIRDLHPDCTRLVYRYRRWHHEVDYTRFLANKLILRDAVVISQGIDNYGLKLVTIV